MYNLKPFDSKRLHVIDWLAIHPLTLLFFAIVLQILLVLLFRNPNLFILLPVVLLFIAFFFLQSEENYIGTVFARKNHLEKFFLKHDEDYGFIYEEYRSMIHSTFLKRERFVWSMPVDNTEFATVFTSDGGCLCWMPLERPFPHLVIDSLQDNPLFGRQWSKRSLPPEPIQLEGNFNHSFHVYQEKDEQIMSLQILSPDRMVALLDEFEAANVEIQDTYLRIYIADVQKSSKAFSAFLDVLSEFQQGFKVKQISSIQ